MSRWESLKEVVFGKKESQTAAIISTPGSAGNVLPIRGYDNFAKETYLKNVTAFRSILEIGRSVASVGWGHYRTIEGDKREKITDSILAQTIKRPNPQDSFEFIMLTAASYLAMSGDAYFEKITPLSGPNKEDVYEIYTHRPDRFQLKINPITGQLEKYFYKIDNRSTSWDVDSITGRCDILHLRNFHPLNDWYGAAPTESAAMEIDTSNAQTQWNMNLINNQCKPGMVYTLVGSAGEGFMDELDQYLRNEKAGVHNVGKNMILVGERGTKAEPYGLSPSDMDFSTGDLRLMRKIAMAYGVPPELLGIQDATYANRAEARLFFWENTIFYYLNYIKGEFNNWLFERGSNEFIDYNLDAIPAMAMKRDKLWERIEKSNFLTLDEKRELVGKDKYEPTEEPGSQIFIDASKIPIGIAAEQEGEEAIEEVEKSLRNQGYDEDEIDLMIGWGDYKTIEKQKFACECLNCGYKLVSEKHCADLKCPKCGGKMRRQERPGPGKSD